MVLATGLAIVSGRHSALRAREGMLLGVAAGALFGVSDIALKYLTNAVGNGVLEVLSPWSVAALLASVVAFYASARSLQLGPGVEVIALTSVAANLIAIVGGILVFRDPIGTGPVAISGRMVAFGLVIFGAALMPAPMRATRAGVALADGRSIDHAARLCRAAPRPLTIPRRPLRSQQHVEQVTDLAVLDERVAQGKLRLDLVAVPPAMSLAQHVALLDQLGQDPVGSSAP